MKKSTNYGKVIAKELQSVSDVKEFLDGMLEIGDDMSAPEALKCIITVMGTTKFAKTVGIPKSRVSEFLKKGDNVKPSTMDQMLKPFGFKTKILYLKVA